MKKAGKFGIYVQVPFCQTKCTYCNFHTGVVSGARFAPYVEALCREIRTWRELHRAAELESGAWPFEVQGKRAANREQDGQESPHAVDVAEQQQADSTQSSQNTQKAQSPETKETHGSAADTIYIGGGTPSLLEPRFLAQVMEAIRETFASQPDEATLEADPETATEEKARAWVAAGINRVSFGVQSFVDKELVAAGRMHRRENVYRAYETLRAAGMANISFDLIAGLPWQTRESWQESLEELAKLGPEHVSVYLLEVDEGSRLGKELLSGGTRYSAGAVPSDDLMAELYETACEFLREAGYQHYEISNWAKPGYESRHNLKYWNREPYLGFGAGAHSFSGSQRWANVHDAAGYVRALEAGKLPVEQRETVSNEMALEEELFLGLRKLEGIDLRKIQSEYGVEIGSRFEEFETAGLIEREGNVVRLAERKLSVSNEVFVGLMR